MFSERTTELIALLILAGVLAALVARLALAVSRSNFSVVQSFYYQFGVVMTRVLWRADVRGRLEIPPGQGAVVICNHRGPLDPAFIQLATDRVVHWMVAREYCDHPLLWWFFRIPQCIPVGRGGIDTAATKLAIRYAERGELVGMLPEGRLNMTDELLLPGRPGAALVALRARVPVVPCFISGSPLGSTLIGTVFVPAKVKLTIGRPIDVSEFYGREKEKEVLEELTRRFLREIARLAGVTDFEPRLAGRHWRPED